MKNNFNWETLDIYFEYSSSQQFATVMFDREEDADEVKITVFRNGLINQFVGDNMYNPSDRRHSACTYIMEEVSPKIVKMCIIQHKGITELEVYEVDDDELIMLFGTADRLKLRLKYH